MPREISISNNEVNIDYLENLAHKIRTISSKFALCLIYMEYGMIWRKNSKECKISDLHDSKGGSGYHACLT